MYSVTAPWCGHCTKLKPEWHSAATTLKGQNAILGWVDATSEQRLAGMFKVQVSCRVVYVILVQPYIISRCDY
jgi:thioredoxin-like negative regulator of GroEL